MLSMLTFFFGVFTLAGLLSSVIVGVSQVSFFSSWVCLELNLLMFVAFMNMGEGGFSVSMKYFIVQSVGSSVFLWGSGMGAIEGVDTFMGGLLLGALGLKLGAAPMHSWFISVLSLMGWELIFLTSTLQKVLPLYLFSASGHSLLSGLILLSAAVGVLGSFNQVFVKKILGYSSVFMTAWALAGESGFSVSMEYLAAYSVALGMLVLLVSGSPYQQISEMLGSLTVASGLVFMSGLWSMGGCPPFVGFYAKISVISAMLAGGHSLWAGGLVASAVVLLYIYMRIFYFSLSLLAANSLSSSGTYSLGSFSVFLGGVLLLPWWLRVGVQHSKFWTFSI